MRRLGTAWLAHWKAEPERLPRFALLEVGDYLSQNAWFLRGLLLEGGAALFTLDAKALERVLQLVPMTGVAMDPDPRAELFPVCLHLCRLAASDITDIFLELAARFPWPLLDTQLDRWLNTDDVVLRGGSLLVLEHHAGSQATDRETLRRIESCAIAVQSFAAEDMETLCRVLAGIRERGDLRAEEFLRERLRDPAQGARGRLAQFLVGHGWMEGTELAELIRDSVTRSAAIDGMRLLASLDPGGIRDHREALLGLLYSAAGEDRRAALRVLCSAASSRDAADTLESFLLQLPGEEDQLAALEEGKRLPRPQRSRVAHVLLDGHVLCASEVVERDARSLL